MGGSMGKSNSDSSNQFSNSVWQPSGDALQQLWSSAFGNLNNNSYQQGVDAQIPGAVEDAGVIYDKASSAYDDQLAGGAYGDSSELREKLLGMMGGQSNTGQMYESIVGGQGNEYIDPLIDRLRADSSQNVDTLQSGVGLDAAAMGQSGSSRHAMENAMIASEANKNLLDKESELRYGGYDKDLEMKMGIANLADSNSQSEQDRLLNMLSGANSSQQGAIDSASLLQSLGMGSMSPYMQAQNSSWSGLNNLANIIGNPTMISSGTGSSNSKGFGSAGGLWG